MMPEQWHQRDRPRSSGLPLAVSDLDPMLQRLPRDTNCLRYLVPGSSAVAGVMDSGLLEIIQELAQLLDCWQRREGEIDVHGPPREVGGDAGSVGADGGHLSQPNNLLEAYQADSANGAGARLLIGEDVV